MNLYLNLLSLILKGGFGSGNRGHSGRPGLRGGSSSKGSSKLSNSAVDFERNNGIYRQPKHNEVSVPLKGKLVRKKKDGTGGYYVCSLETQQKMDALKEYAIEHKQEIDILTMMKKDRIKKCDEIGEEVDRICEELPETPETVAKLDELYTELKRTKKEVDDLDKEILDTRIKNQMKMFKILGVPKEESANITVQTQVKHQSMLDTMNRGTEIINILASRSGFATFGTPVIAKEVEVRSFADSSVNTVNIQTNSKARVVTHEIGHLIEANSARNSLNCLEFLEMRANSPQIKKLNEIYSGVHEVYKEDEVAYEDSFVTVYAGKVYPDKSTEILSVGLEEITRDPIEFMRRDPEHFSFTLDLIQGRYIEKD